MNFIISVILAYLIGSISCAILISKFLKLPDPRTQGSGNAGATNIARISGKQTAIYVLVGDALKGIIALVIAHTFHLHGVSLAFIALVVVIGHVFPIYFKFKGGKGVATMIGAVMVLSFWVAVFLIAIWIILALIFRYASLASIVTAVAAPIFLLIAGRGNCFFPVLLITGLILWKHWGNIKRLRDGTESKIQF